MTTTTHKVPTEQVHNALVHTTANTGPARQLIDEWEHLCISRPILKKVNAWGLTTEPVSHLDELLTYAGFGRATDDSAADHVLWKLVCLAEHNELAARIVLHRILPAVMSVAQRRGRLLRGGTREALDEVIPVAWMVIRTFPHQRRRSKIASNLSRDIEYHAFVRHTRLRAPNIDHNAYHRLPNLTTAEQKIDPADELNELLHDACVAGLSQRNADLLRDIGKGMTTNEAAAARQVSPRTMRNHKNAAIAEFLVAHQKATTI